MPARNEHSNDRAARFETLEDRIVLSGQSLADFYLDDFITQQVDDVQHEVAPTLDSANDASGANYLFENYGFDGSGQTVAVIDSGIAYDHTALGGGFGANHRVVGGWDFAENDANPYDDGPAGFHGTHVAGIIGSDDATHPRCRLGRGPGGPARLQRSGSRLLQLGRRGVAVGA